MAAQFIFTMRDLRRFYPPDREVLKGINLSFYPGAKIGVIGPNGSGKSSLLRIMAGLDDGFSGEARLTPGFSVGYLSQEPTSTRRRTSWATSPTASASSATCSSASTRSARRWGTPTRTSTRCSAEQSDLQTRIDAANAWDLERTLEIAMDALRLPPSDADVTKLSGGERRRVALCRLLLSKPDLLLLDEPTNHLDAESVAWLERALQDYAGTVVAITHDRYFLDNAASWILELDRGRGDPLGGQLLLVARAEAGPPGRRGEGRQGSPGRAPARTRVDPDVAAGPPEQGQGARDGVQRTGRRVRSGRASRRPWRSRSRRSATGRRVVKAERRPRDSTTGSSIEDLSFLLPPGGIVGVIGPNGAGKTTLFR